MQLEEFKIFVGNILFQIIKTSFDLAIFWVPAVLCIIFVRAWLYYVRADYNAHLSRTLLEIKLPKDVYKSPAAMEIVLGALHQAGSGSWYDQWWKGRVRTWSSLEMVSIEGKVKFFIWIESKFRQTLEAQVYSQYPTAEIHEVDDYTRRVPFGHEGSGWALFGSEFRLTKADPYPIKTYVDYGLDKDPKEEFKIDPITSVMEFLGSVGKNEQIWVQIGVRATTGKNIIPGGIFGKKYDWKKVAEKEIEDLKEKITKFSGAEKYASARATKSQENVITAIERNIAKPGFDCGIRALYLAKNNFNGTVIPALMGHLKQYGSHELNGFKPVNFTSFDFWWQDYKNMRMSKIKADLFNAYVRRSWFYPPYVRKPFVLNAEELATIFHFPGRVAETAAFERIESKKSEAPANLPI